MKTILFKNYALYKDYLNLCDLRTGSYVTLETRATHSKIIYMPLGCSMQNMHLVYWFEKNIF